MQVQNPSQFILSGPFFLDLSEASCSHLIRWICAVTSIQKVAGSSSTPKPWLSSAYDGVVSQPVRQLGEIETEIEEPFSGWWFEGHFLLSSLPCLLLPRATMQSPMERRISPNFDQLCLLECNPGIQAVATCSRRGYAGPDP